MNKVSKKRLVELMGGATPTEDEQVYLDKMRADIDRMFKEENERALREKVAREERLAYVKECKVNKNKYRNMKQKLRRKG